MTSVSPRQRVLHQDAAFRRPSKTHRPPLRPRFPSIPPPPPLPHLHNNAPASEPMSKANTTDQQLDMQIVSQDKLCVACQLHMWALGWLSVTCVRVPLHLCRATLMTGCWVGLHPTSPPAPTTLSQPPSQPSPITRQCVTSRRAKDLKKERGKRRKLVL